MPLTWTELERTWGPRLSDHLASAFDERVNRTFLELNRRDSRVVGVGFGPRQTRGEIVDEASVIFFVERKLIRERLTPSIEIPDRVAGWPTDVREVGRIRTLAVRYDRPVPWGSGVELVDRDPAAPTVTFQSETGTLGGVVYDKNGVAYVLSNAHVLAPGPSATTADSYPGLPVQQGLVTAHKDEIAKLTRRVDVVPFTNMQDSHCWNYVDAAIAKIDTSALGTELVQKDPRGVSITGWRAHGDVHPKLPVRYFGWQEPTDPTGQPGFREGFIVAINVSWKLPYEGHLSLFKSQFAMGGLPQRGDSGSLAFAANSLGRWEHSSLVGLVFAGTTIDRVGPAPSTPVTLINPIDAVFSRLKVTRGARWAASQPHPLTAIPGTFPKPIPWPPVPRPRLPGPDPTPEPFSDIAAWLRWRGVEAPAVDAIDHGGERVLRVSGVPSDFALPAVFGGQRVMLSP